MKIVNVAIKDFKRFKSLEISDLPKTARMIILVGPNGSGKSSIFDGFLHFVRQRRFGTSEELFSYYLRGRDNWEKRHKIIQDLVKVEFDQEVASDWDSVKSLFYFRSAYRFEGSFTLTNLSRQGPIADEDRFTDMSKSDVSVSKNYARLAGKIVNDVHDKVDDAMPKGEWRESRYRPLQASLTSLFPKLKLESPGNPFDEGTFLFSKGSVEKFHYGLLSSGEKSAFDLILDLFIRKEAFPNGIFCFDEPESHINTNLHGAVLKELFLLTPDQGQIWVATHSIGMIRKAAEIEHAQPGSVVFLDFHEHDFDQPVILTPAKVNASFWSRNLSTTLADLAELIAPKRVILCEGARVDYGAKKAEFDAQCYQRIFEAEYPDTLFISVGASNDIITGGAALRGIIRRIAQGIEVITLIDRDERTKEEIEEVQRMGHRVLPLRHIEHYLFAPEVLERLCRDCGKPEEIENVFADRTRAVASLVERNLLSDDLKRAKGEIYNSIKARLKNTGVSFGSNADAFCRDVLARRVLPGMQIYNDLKAAIFVLP